MSENTTMEALNYQLQELLVNKQLSPRKIRNLILLRKMINRLATKPYISDEEVASLEEKFGDKPDMITWGDYFQVEVGIEHADKSDNAFEKVIQTITFDLIAAILIFTDKDKSFITQIKDQQMKAQIKPAEKCTSNDEESIHLGILLGYFHEMGLNMRALTDQDIAYFEQFASKKAVS